MKTFEPNVKDIKRNWYLIDAENQILGRLATKVAGLLYGKGKPEFARHVDTGDEVIVINAAKIRVTGNKMQDKIYQRFSGYPGGRKVFKLETMMEKNPQEVITHAVKGMLPHNPLGRKMLKRLKVYAQAEHVHQAQNPKEIKR